MPVRTAETAHTMEIYKVPLYLARWGDRFTCPIPLKLNPYYGCSHNCPYCFAVQMKKPNQPPRDEVVIPADVSVVDKFLREALEGDRHQSIMHKCLRNKMPIQMGVLTDPFLPEELHYRTTLKLLKLLHEFEYPVIVVTKGDIIQRDEYVELLEDMPAVVHLTMGSLYPDFAAMIEPRAPSPQNRLWAGRKLSHHDIPVMLRYNPIFPLINDQPEELFKTAALHGFSDVQATFARMFNFKRFKTRLDNMFGFDYVQHLKDEGYPIEKEKDFYHVHHDHIEAEHLRFKELAENEGMNYYTPNILWMNNFGSCCGTDKHFPNKADWALYCRANKIEDHTSFEEYIEGVDCPFETQFKKMWEEGQVTAHFHDLVFNKEDKTYSRMEGK